MPLSSRPIFIHALFRSGSTFLFKAFRRSSAGYWCYQEPLHEALACLNNCPDRLLSYGSESLPALRHPTLSKPYFFEFHEIKESLAGHFSERFSYDRFFLDPASKLPDDLRHYLLRLIECAKGRPVLQFCRSSGRAQALGHQFDATHIHLWRNPRDQWWSYKASPYFDATTRLILSSEGLPSALQQIRDEAGIHALKGDKLSLRFADAYSTPLKSAESYRSFYACWLYAFLHCEEAAGISINIDQLTESLTYREAILRQLEDAGISGLDFSDCAVPRSSFSQTESKFYQAIEAQVTETFTRAYPNHEGLAQAREAQKRSEDIPAPSAPQLIEQASRARMLAMDYANNWATALGDPGTHLPAPFLASRWFRMAYRMKNATSSLNMIERKLRHFIRNRHTYSR